MTGSQRAVIVGLLLFVLLYFGIVLFQLRVPESSPTPPPPAFLLEDEAQARRAYPVAKQEALSWQDDAQLSSVGTVWDDLGPGGILKRDHWTFEFYSPSRQEMAVIRVEGDQAERLRTSLVPEPLTLLPLEQWRVDSTEAFKIWWERGGAKFIEQREQIAISLKLRLMAQTRQAQWIVTGSSSGEHWVIQLASEDGEVLQ
jgi:hypothetical protein